MDEPAQEEFEAGFCLHVPTPFCYRLPKLCATGPSEIDFRSSRKEP